MAKRRSTIEWYTKVKSELACKEADLHAKLPPPVEKWDGFWGGTEESRVLYLKENYHLWGFIREKDVVRRTGVFFIPKKPGDPRLRKILACLDANNAMVAPQKKQFYQAPGTSQKSVSGKRDSGLLKVI